MANIFINSRDILITIDPNLVAFVLADGNYSRVLYINKREISLTMGISKVDELLKANGGKRNKFLRLGRSVIINHIYLHKIDLLRQLLILSDGRQELRLNLSKKLLKSYKEAVVRAIEIKGGFDKNSIQINDNHEENNIG